MARPRGRQLPQPVTVPPFDAERFVSSPVAAEFLHLSHDTLRHLRCRGGGPPFSRFGAAIRYRLGDLRDWARARRVRTTSDPDPLAA